MSGWDGGRGEREGPAPLVEPGGHKPLAPVRVSMPASWAGLPPAFGPQPAVRPPLRPEPQALCSGPGSAPWVRAGGCRPPLCPRPHALHLVFADFARTRFKDVRSMVSALEEASFLPQDAASAVPRELGHEKKSAFDNFSGDVGVNPFCL